MTSLRRGDVVWVPFPFVAVDQEKSRPALFIGGANVGPAGALFWASMITSAANAPWPGDVTITDLELAELPIPSVVRIAKLATLEVRTARRVGRLSEADQSRVLDFARRIFG